MRTSRIGDRIQAHYTKRFNDGSVRSSRQRGDEPVEFVVGTDHPRLRGVATGMVGLVAGQKVKIPLTPEADDAKSKPAKICSVDRARFQADADLAIGKGAAMRVAKGRTRRVLILEVHDKKVVIDANHLRSERPLELEVELIAILGDS